MFGFTPKKMKIKIEIQREKKDGTEYQDMEFDNFDDAIAWLNDRDAEDFERRDAIAQVGE
jgi:hypothetical protein